MRKNSPIESTFAGAVLSAAAGVMLFRWHESGKPDRPGFGILPSLLLYGPLTFGTLGAVVGGVVLGAVFMVIAFAPDEPPK